MKWYDMIGLILIGATALVWWTVEKKQVIDSPHLSEMVRVPEEPEGSRQFTTNIVTSASTNTCALATFCFPTLAERVLVTNNLAYEQPATNNVENITEGVVCEVDGICYFIEATYNPSQIPSRHAYESIDGVAHYDAVFEVYDIKNKSVIARFTGTFTNWRCHEDRKHVLIETAKRLQLVNIKKEDGENE